MGAIPNKLLIAEKRKRRGLRMTQDNGIPLGEDGPDWNKMKVSLNTYKGHHLLQIGKWYKDKKVDPNTGKREDRPKPGRQGVSLNRDNVMELKRVFDQEYEAIESYLAIGHVPDAILRYYQAEEEAKKKGFRLRNEVEIKENSDHHYKSLFEVKHKGSTDEVIISNNHPFAKAISEAEIAASTPEEIRELFAVMMACFARTTALLLGASYSTTNIVFAKLEDDWSNFLASYIEEV